MNNTDRDKKSEYHRELEKSHAELQSLKQSICESKLAEYFPNRDMSFHDKVVVAISKLTTPESESRLSELKERVEELDKDDQFGGLVVWKEDILNIIEGL